MHIYVELLESFFHLSICQSTGFDVWHFGLVAAEMVYPVEVCNRFFSAAASSTPVV